MSFRANNNNNLAHFLNCLHPALRLILLHCLQSQSKQRRSHMHKNAHVILKMSAERQHSSEADRAQINKAFGYFKKMTEEARRQPRAAPRPQLCVYLQSYSWGKGKEQQSSNRATESLFLVLFAVGSFETPSPLTGNEEQQHEKRNGTDPEENAHRQTHHYGIRYSHNYNHSVSFLTAGLSHYRIRCIVEELRVSV